MKKRKTLPKEMKELLENGDISALKEQFYDVSPMLLENMVPTFLSFSGDFHPFR